MKNKKNKTSLGNVKLRLIILVVITLSLAFILTAIKQRQDIRQRAAVSQTDYSQYVNVIQSRQVFMRYPLGRIGLWSTNTGEIVDSVTRGVRIYPMVDQIVSKDNTDWRTTITANPSEADIVYNNATAAKGSTVAMTVTPNVSVYRYHFNNISSFGAVGVTLGNTQSGGTQWTNNTFTVIDNQTVQVTLGNGSRTIYYYIKFNVSGAGTSIGNGGYVKFGSTTTDVTVAVALSHSSMAQAQTFFTNEFSDFNFAAATQRLKDAWNAKLGKIDVQNADQLTKQKVYTGLYSVYANIINATDGSPYAQYVAAYGSPLLTIGSSVHWAYIGGGYFRAAFDQGRSIYYLLTLLDPQVMTDILHTYQAQYDRDKVLLGNWDPYTPSAWTDQQWGFWGGMFLRANLMGVTGVDYNKAKNSIADTFGNTNNIMSKSQYLTKGYIPADGGVSNFMSRALDWSTDIHGLALLANVLGDNATYNQWITRGQNYKNNWDAANAVFRGKNADGSWAALGNAGFFEGTAQTYAFDEPQDVLGLADLYGDSTMTSKINTLFASGVDYNDYLLQCQYMPIYSNSPSTAQNIIRSIFIPKFNSLNMWESGGGGDMYYTHNAGEVVLATLGLYPFQAPGAQWAINSPAVTTAVIHGIKDITIQANNNSQSNIYVSSIQVNGLVYPSHFISGKSMIANNTTITLNMTNTPSRIGAMYITGADGEVLTADTDNVTYLRFQNDPIATTSRAKIYATKQPTSMTVNGSPLSTWTYDSVSNTINIKGIPAGTVLVSFGGVPPSATPTIHPTPTNIISPTPTIPAGNTVFGVTVYLHGIGNGGDNANPNSGGNPNPLHKSKPITITVFNASNQLVMTVQGNLLYLTGDGKFGGYIDMGMLASGNYLAKIRTDGFLTRQISGIITVTQGQINNISSVSLIAGDINNDNQLDILDYNILISCFGIKQNASSCTAAPTQKSSGADINDDGSVDGIDYNLFLRELSVQAS